MKEKTFFSQNKKFPERKRIMQLIRQHVTHVNNTLHKKKMFFSESMKPLRNVEDVVHVFRKKKEMI